jgi:hypothetical protein
MLFSTPVFATSNIADQADEWAVDSIKQLRSLGQFREEAFKGYKEKISRAEAAYLAARAYEILTGQEIVIDETLDYDENMDEYSRKAITLGIDIGEYGIIQKRDFVRYMARVMCLIEVDMDSVYARKNIAKDKDAESYVIIQIFQLTEYLMNKVVKEDELTVQVALVMTKELLIRNHGLYGKKLDGSQIKMDIKNKVEEHKVASINEKIKAVVHRSNHMAEDMFVKLSEGTMDYSSDTIKYHIFSKHRYYNNNNLITLENMTSDFNEIINSYLNNFEKARTNETHWMTGKNGTVYKIIHNEKDAYIHIKKDSLNFDLNLSEFDRKNINYDYKYYSDTMLFSLSSVHSWVDNSYKAKKGNTHKENIELIDEMLEPGGLDITDAGTVQKQYSSEKVQDRYALRVNQDANGDIRLEIRVWAIRGTIDYATPNYIIVLNGTREILKFYTNNSDAELIYEEINKLYEADERYPKYGKIQTFGNSKVVIELPDVWGVDIVIKQ